MYAKILITEEDETLLENLKGLLLDQKFKVIEATDKDEVFRFFQTGKPDLVVIGSSWDSNQQGLNIAEMIRDLDKNVPIILITQHSSEDHAIAALKVGINDYFKEPFICKKLVASINQCLPDHKKNFMEVYNSDPMIGNSKSMRKIKNYLLRIAETDSTVFITGETGTGKELAAEMIHRYSRRYNKPFIPVNCAALPENLLESELFGYERGAFTGAYSSYAGKLKIADNGTVLFDEICELSLCAQAKILRVIETKEFFPVGGKRSVPIDVRIITATNKNPEQLIRHGSFREDLYYRLNVVRVHMPPLCERKEDIPMIIEHTIRELNHKFHRQVQGFTENTLDSLLEYNWPGNVRELKNLLEATFINVPSQTISLKDLPETFRNRLKEIQGFPKSERDQLLAALFTTNWNKSKAAMKLQWSRKKLYRKMEKYKINNR